MTHEQRERIVTLRHEGWGYKKISAKLGISADTVKSFCRTEGLGGTLAVPGHISDDEHCRECGTPLIQMAGVKKRRFCSPECRVKWWASHRESIRQKAVYRFTCPNCRKELSAYGNSSRKYCFVLTIAILQPDSRMVTKHDERTTFCRNALSRQSFSVQEACCRQADFQR